MALPKILVLGLDRVNRGFGPTNVKPTGSSSIPTTLDLSKGNVRKSLRELGDQVVVLGERGVARTEVITLATGTSGGGVLSWQNPTGESIHVKDVALNVTTKATAAATVDVGTTATSATTLSDNLIDGLDVGTAAGFFSSLDSNGTNGKKGGQVLAAGKWVTGSQASGAVAGLVGVALITYVRATA